MSDVAAAPVSNAQAPEVTADNNPQNGAAEAQAKAKQQQNQPEEPWKKQKHRYKAAGKEYEVEYDELIKRAEKGHGAEKRFQEASAKEKAFEERMKRMRDPSNEDFSDLVEMIGFERAKKFADRLVWDSIQWDELPEHEKRRILAEQERDEAKSQLTKRQKEDEERAKQQRFAEADRVISEEISRVLADAKKQGLAVADIPEAKELIIDEMLAYINYMDECEAKGMPIQSPPPSHEDVLRKIQERYDTSSSAYLKRLSVDKLMKVLTKEQLSALRQAEIDQLYAPIPGYQGRSKKQAQDDTPPRPSRKPNKMTTDEFFRKLDERYGG